MALAVALNLMAPDHWAQIDITGLVGGHDHGAHDHGAAAQAHRHSGDEHSRHCHGDAATCSDIPLSAVGGLVLLGAVLAFAGGALSRGRLVVSPSGTFAAWTAGPATPPPRFALSASV